MRRRRWPRACGRVEEPGLEPGDEEEKGPRGSRGRAGLVPEGKEGGSWRYSWGNWPRARRERRRALEQREKNPGSKVSLLSRNC